MSSELPASAAWRHVGVREGFEVLFANREAGAHRLEGYSAGVEGGQAWGVRYELNVDRRWITRSARIVTHGRELRLEADGEGRWLVDGDAAPHLDGCLDVDLEVSACTNALPVRRLELAVGDEADAPAAYVRADLRVERLEQRYARLDARRYGYAAPDLGFRAVLVYDEHGLVLDYPGIAVRAA